MVEQRNGLRIDSHWFFQTPIEISNTFFFINNRFFIINILHSNHLLENISLEKKKKQTLLVQH